MLPRELYDMMPYILGGLIFLMGIAQFLFPKQMTAKKFKDDPEKVAQIKKGGISMMVIGVLFVIIQVALAMMQM